MSGLRIVAIAGVSVLCSSFFPLAAIGQAGACSAFAGHWKGQTNSYDILDFSISADGKTLAGTIPSYAYLTVPCRVNGAKIDLQAPAAGLNMGLDGKGTLRYGTQTKVITMKRVE
jgi:hypothetical protein